MIDVLKGAVISQEIIIITDADYTAYSKTLKTVDQRHEEEHLLPSCRLCDSGPVCNFKDSQAASGNIEIVPTDRAFSPICRYR